MSYPLLYRSKWFFIKSLKFIRFFNHKFNFYFYVFSYCGSEYTMLDVVLTYDKPYTRGVHDVIINNTTTKARGIWIPGSEVTQSTSNNVSGFLLPSDIQVNSPRAVVSGNQYELIMQSGRIFAETSIKAP